MAIGIAAGGSVTYTFNITTSNVTLSPSQKVLLVDASNGDVTVTLPSGIKGSEHVIKKVDKTSHKVVVSGGWIDGQSQIVLGSAYDTIKITSDGTNWYVTNWYVTSDKKKAELIHRLLGLATEHVDASGDTMLTALSCLHTDVSDGTVLEGLSCLHLNDIILGGSFDVRHAVQSELQEYIAPNINCTVEEVTHDFEESLVNTAWEY